MVRTGEARAQNPSFASNIFACAAIGRETGAREFRSDAIIIAIERGWRWKKKFPIEIFYPRIVGDGYGV